MKYAYLDESGGVEKTTSNLVVAVLVVGHPDRLRKAVTKTRKSLGKRLKEIPEFRASGTDPRLRKKLLTHAAEIGFESVAIVIDKSEINPIPLDPEDLYRTACGRIVSDALERFGPLSLTLDRRYSKKELRDRLDQAIIEGVRDTGQTLVLQHQDSKREPLLQIADAIAGAIFQKYERDNTEFWDIIRESVVISQTL